MCCAGIVLYHPEEQRLKDNINAILPQVEKLVLVDNASGSLESILAEYNQNDKLVMIRNKKNLGIATALNQIFEWADQNGFPWVLTLDQDSICDQDMIEKYLYYIDGGASIGILCPRFITDVTKPSKCCKAFVEAEYIELCITSGSFTSVEAWKEVHGFDDWMFIDCVDYDFCMRLRLHHYKILRINSITLQHQVGRAEIKKVFGRSIVLYNHSSIRNYYFVRNSIYLLRKYKGQMNYRKQFLYVLYWEFMKIIFEKNRLKTINSAIRGALDGFSVKIK